ncbi:MAG TPA: serine/threonine-protein kinase [Vicinamibacterales bacterium]
MTESTEGPTLRGPIGVVAHYNLLERLDPSGPGELFRARDTRLGRTVAIRWLPADFVSGPSARHTLVEQARAMAVLSHPNVITLFDAGEHDERVFLAFEFLKGQSLRQEMAGRHLNVHRAVEAAVQIADAIATAHAAGFVHGGLSPDSVSMTARGHAKVPAFELAAHTGFAASDGKLHDYDSPEEMQGHPPDDRSDVYSVGAILYEMLTGRRPNAKGSAAASESNRHVPKELDDLVLRAVAPNPDARPQSMALFAGSLRAVVAQLDAHGGASDEAGQYQGTAPRRGSVLLWVAVVVVLGVAAWWLSGGAGFP